VVADVLIAERDAHDPLPDQRRQGVHHLVLLAPIPKACRDAVDQADCPIGVSQQQPAGIRGHRPTIERRHHPPVSQAFKLELLGATLCSHRTPCSNLVSV
jgi:hypothetical protein